MALDFPASPINGQVYGSYVYNSTVGAWQAREDSATVAVTSPTAPTTANNGDIWYNSNTGVSYLYYADGSSAQWVEIVSSAVPLLDTKADLAGGNAFTGAQAITSTATTQTPLIINGITSQTADLQQWKNSAGTVLAKIEATGNLSGQALLAYNYSQSIAGTAATVPSVVRGAASQTADLQQWQNSGGTVLAEIDSVGILTTPRVISTQTTGTAPFTVASTTLVSNLNADMIDGYHESALVLTRSTGVSTNSTDFNTIVTPGSYGVGGNGNWTGSSNAPTAAYAYGQLVVTVNGNIVTQSYYTHTTGGHYVRTKYNVTDWQAWQKISTDYTSTPGIPYRMAAGSIATGAYAGTASGWYYYSNVTVTYPASRFSFAPIVSVTPQINGVSTAQVSTTNGTTSFAVGYAVLGGQSAGSLHWNAIQMTSGAAGG